MAQPAAQPLPSNPYNPFAWVTGTPSIGKGCNISSGAQVLSHSTVRRCLSERRYDRVDTKATEVGDFVFVGANAVIQMGSWIGDHCVIAAGSMVLEDTVIPPYS